MWNQVILENYWHNSCFATKKEMVANKLQYLYNINSYAILTMGVALRLYFCLMDFSPHIPKIATYENELVISI